VKQYTYDIGLLAAAVIPALASLVVDLQFANEYFWLQRAGSIMVLSGIILDVRQYGFSETEESPDLTVNGKPAIIGSVVPESRKRLQRVAVALAVVGTLIWGYGDVPFRVT
jgi:hypothetical protein